MSTSQNGWAAIDSGSDKRLVNLSWVTGKVRSGDVHTILDHLARRFHNEVEPIRKDWSWGYAPRPIRGSTTTSNHASGTAVDFNAPEHPLGRTGTFSTVKRAALLRILNDLGGVVRWGGTYSGRKDEMHFEINATSAQVAALAARLRGGAAAKVTNTTATLIATYQGDKTVKLFRQVSTGGVILVTPRGNIDVIGPDLVALQDAFGPAVGVTDYMFLKLKGLG